MSAESKDSPDPPTPVSAWRVTYWICCGLVVLSVLSCVAVAALRSQGLTQVTVTALDPETEPRDHGIPLIKQKEALPDYEVIVNLSRGPAVKLGAKPNTSAKDGLVWVLNDPVPVAEVSGIRLQEQDKVIQDVITEVQIAGASVETENYRFEFEFERSLAVGVKSFFATPVGKAISFAFVVAVLLMLASAISA